VAGANKTGVHLRGVEHGRDFQARFADIRTPTEGDRCPECGGALHFQTAIEVGHIFKLGTKYSAGLGATFLDEDGREQTIIMGSYGIGPARVMAAAIEQRHDENGIIWPRAIAPYDVHVVVLKGAEEIGEQAARALDAAGFEVLLDDRDQRPGEKFADADLIGCPIRVTAGKKSLEDGKVDVRDRATGEERRLAVADLGKEL
jgi:prolyl-tRNA synthetase